MDSTGADGHCLGISRVRWPRELAEEEEGVYESVKERLNDVILTGGAPRDWFELNWLMGKQRVSELVSAYEDMRGTERERILDFECRRVGFAPRLSICGLVKISQGWTKHTNYKLLSRHSRGYHTLSCHKP